MPIPTNGLLLWLRLSDGSGTTPQDSSGNGNHGAFVGAPTWVTGSPPALDFDAGNPDAVQVSGLLSEPSAATLLAWVDFDAIDTTFNLSDALSLGDYILLRLTTTGFQGLYRHASNWHTVEALSGSLIGAGFMHIAYVTDPAQGRQELYLNGVSVASDTETDAVSWVGQGSHTFVGAHGNGASLDYDGRMHDVLVYNRALSTEEVAGVMAGPAPDVAASSDVGGGGRVGRRQPLPWWWHSYFEQWLEELEEREREYRRLKAKKDAEAAEKRKQEALARIAVQREQRERQDAIEQARRKTNAAELRQRVQGARDDRVAEQAALGQRAQGALERVEARKLQAQAETDAEELRKLRQIARSPHRRFNQRFEAAITAARRQGWRAK